MKYTIVFIGAGNLATHLSRKLYDLGHNIIQVYSRSKESAKELADTVNATYITNMHEVVDSADFYIFSIKDSVLQAHIENMPHSKGTWIHTAGSVSINVFERKANDFGVLYPLQTFSKARVVEWGNIPVFIEEVGRAKFSKIEDIANQLSAKVYLLSSENRMYLHTSAVFACNFVNHMYSQAKDLVERGGLPFDVLLPLIDETSKKVHELAPRDAQTGPAIRFDENVINKHLESLNDKAREIYKLLSNSIYNDFRTEPKKKL